MKNLFAVTYYRDNHNGYRGLVSLFSSLEKAQEFLMREIKKAVEDSIGTKDLKEQFKGNYELPEKNTEITASLNTDIKYQASYSDTHFQYREEMDCNDFLIEIKKVEVDNKRFYSIQD